MSKASENLVVDLTENEEHIEMHLAVLKRCGFERALVLDGMFAFPYFDDDDRELAIAVMLDWFWHGDGRNHFRDLGELHRRFRWAKWRSMNYLISKARMAAI